MEPEGKSLSERDEFLDKIDEAERSIEALERAGLNSIVVDSPEGHQFYTLVGTNQPYGILIDSVNEAAVCLSAEGAILYCNTPFGKILKESPMDLIGRLFIDFFDDREKLKLLKSLRTETQGKMELHLVLEKGDFSPVYVCFSSITINGVNCVYVLLTDVSEKEQYLAELLEKNKSLEHTLEARDSFLAAMSHNLRTPLNSIIGFTDILLAQMPGPLNETQVQQMEIIKRCSKQLLTLIRQLLDVGLIQHHKLDPVIAPCDINGIIQDVMQELKPIADQKEIDFSYGLVADEYIINTDRKFFRQIIVNLLDNAIKYTKVGTVKLSQKDGDETLEIHVSDTGCGIREEDLTEIFQLYSTVHKKHDPYGEHTGLGLVLCCKYCELLGMKLTCDSDFGKGTTFTIHIPKRLKS